MSVASAPVRNTVEGETRIRLSGVDWDTFQKLALNSRGARFAYDRGVLEIMSPGPLHELDKALLSDFIRVVARTLRIPQLGMGSTTWGRKAADRGLEADECYYFDPNKIKAANEASARKSNDAADYPPPDLAVEVDLSPPKVDRAAIYASIRVAEVWRFDGETVTIERLNESGGYDPVPCSGFLPVCDADVRRWIVEEDATDRLAWEDRLAEWARSMLSSNG